MNEEQQIIFNGLRDLHLPPPVSAWPPAAGWWAVAIALSVVIGGALVWLVRLRRQRNPRQQASILLRKNFADWQTNGNPAAYLRQSHHVLRQLAIELAGRACVASLCGDQWADWLEQQVDQPLPAAARLALVRGAYQREGIGNASIEQVHMAYLRWVTTARKPARVLRYEGAETIRPNGSVRIAGAHESQIKPAAKEAANESTHA